MTYASGNVALGLPARICVSGDTGAGKTTLARRLAAIIGGVHVELDSLYHGPNWTPADDDVFRARVLERSASGVWVIDGNYQTVRDLTWGRAELLIWLDYALWRKGWRLFWRCLRRGVRQEELWNGNRESLRTHFLTKDSLFVWLLKTHWRRRQLYPERIALYPQLRVARLRSPRELERWLAARTP